MGLQKGSLFKKIYIKIPINSERNWDTSQPWFVWILMALAAIPGDRELKSQHRGCSSLAQLNPMAGSYQMARIPPQKNKNLGSPEL